MGEALEKKDTGDSSRWQEEMWVLRLLSLQISHHSVNYIMILSPYQDNIFINSGRKWTKTVNEGDFKNHSQTPKIQDHDHIFVQCVSSAFACVLNLYIHQFIHDNEYILKLCVICSIDFKYISKIIKISWKKLFIIIDFI